MSHSSTRNLIFTAIALSVALGTAHAANDDAATAASGRQTGGSEVLLLTGGIVNLACDRVVDEMAEHYQLSVDQVDALREEVRARFPRFLLDNRDELARIANAYAEAMLSAEPPSKESVADLATRTMPLVNQFAELVYGTCDAIRPVLSETQQLQMDSELMLLDVAVEHVNNRMLVWSQGGFDWRSEWVRSEEFKHRERERVAQLRAEQDAAAAPAPGHESRDAAAGVDIFEVRPPAPRRPSPAPNSQPSVDEWTAYVERFIVRYQLNAAQQGQAQRFLRTLLAQRDQYVRRNVQRIETIERELARAPSAAARAPLAAQLDAIQQRLDSMFERLKDKLETLPTRQQRAEAARSGATEPMRP